MANLIAATEGRYRRLSTVANLSFPSVEPQTFQGLEVHLAGAALGDSVDLTEPYQRAAGISFFSYVSAADTVRVCARNNTGNLTISVPNADYGLTIHPLIGL